jgi:hypothetical protein
MTVLTPPVPIIAIPQPALLEEPPIPVGLVNEIQAPTNNPSISLVLPTNTSLSKPEANDDQKVLLSLNNVDDPSATLSQQEELSVKGTLQSMGSDTANITDEIFVCT